MRWRLVLLSHLAAQLLPFSAFLPRFPFFFPAPTTQQQKKSKEQRVRARETWCVASGCLLEEVGMLEDGRLFLRNSTAKRTLQG